MLTRARFWGLRCGHQGGLMRLSKGRVWFAVLAVLAFGVTGWAQASSSLQVVHTVQDSSIAIGNGAGRPPESTQVHLTLVAPAADEVPLDLVLVVDRSATTDIEFVQEIGEFFLSALPLDGRIALVSFAEEANVDVELTTSTQLFRAGLNKLRNIGKTAIGDGLFEATQHLLQRGRPEAVWVEVLITDGRANAGRNPRLQAERAADNGIQIVTVGMGRNPDENLLRDVAEITGGSFFREFGFSAIEEVLDLTDLTVSATDLTIVETLAPGIDYGQALVNPPTRVSVDAFLGTMLEWNLDAINAGQRWTTSFTISSTEEGTRAVNQAPSEINFTDFRGRKATHELPRLQLSVLPPLPPNQLPTVSFSFTPETPTTSREVAFTDESFDIDGVIVNRFWDFGDGGTSGLKNPSHRYTQDGAYQVTLTVTDDRKEIQSLTRKLLVETKSINISRTIDTFLPTDITLGGEHFRVTLKVEINTVLNGMGVTENINQGVPDGWTISPIDHGAANFRDRGSPQALQWVFLEILNPGDVRTITYEVAVPVDANPGIFIFKGVVSSASPSTEIKTVGDEQVEIKDSLPLETVISRWDPPSSPDEQGRLNLQLSDQITFDQVQQAVSWWLDNEVVPFTGSKRIDFATIQSIIARWLTETPITKALPGSKP